MALPKNYKGNALNKRLKVWLCSVRLCFLLLLLARCGGDPGPIDKAVAAYHALEENKPLKAQIDQMTQKIEELRNSEISAMRAIVED